jgi:pre-mRNA-processing factor 19
MICSISGVLTENPVISVKSGLLFEKCLIEKLIDENGRCPITNEKLSHNDLISLRINKKIRPRIAPAASIPSLLGLFHNEWDSLMLENHQLRQELILNRQELAHAIYQHDAACRVIARLIQERNEARDAFKLYCDKTKSSTGDSSGKAHFFDPKVQFLSEISSLAVPNSTIDDMLKKSLCLSSSRKKKKMQPTLATPEDIMKYEASFFDLPKVRNGIASIDVATEHEEVIAIGGNNGQILLFDRTQHRVLTVCSHSNSTLTSVKFGNSSQTFVSASLDGSVKLWHHDNASSYVSTTFAHDNGVVKSFIHPMKEHIISVCEKAQWCLWDYAEEKIVGCISEKIPRKKYTASELHPDGLILGIGTNDAVIQLFDYRVAGMEVARFPKSSSSDYTNEIKDLDFNQNGYSMASLDKTHARIWDLRKSSCVWSHCLHEPGMYTTSVFDHSGRFLALGGSSLEIYDAKQSHSGCPHVKTCFNTRYKQIQSIKFGTNASHLAAGGDNNILTIYKSKNLS